MILMTTLKENIEKKFDWDLDKLKDQASAYELVSGPVGYSNGYRTASAELKSEVLPILLECISALEFYTLKSNYSVINEGRNYNINIVTYELDEETYDDKELGTRARLVLERLRKWSECG